MNKDKISLVVSSCDQYSDLWPLFSYFFDKYWANCALDKYFLSNDTSCNLKGFKTLKVGKDKGWSANLIKGLYQINTPYVLILLDDVFINSNVDNKLFDNICNEFIENDGNYLKFLSHPKSKFKSRSEHYNVLPKGSLYRSTAVFALWNKETLLQILRSNENPWEFEIKGSIRSDEFDNFFVVRKDFFQFIHSVVRGKFLNSAYKKIKEEDNKLLVLIKRDINSPFYELRQRLVNLRHKIFYLVIPMKNRRRIRSMLKGEENV